MLTALEPLLSEVRPDATLVYGDTNSTLAGALAAAQARVPVVHVEAGMRSFDRAMPEELNRVLTDHLSELLLCSSQAAVENLRAESLAGTRRGRRRRDGRRRPALAAGRARQRAIAGRLRPASPAPTCCSPPIAPATSMTPSRLRALVELIDALPAPVLFPVHPRTRARLQDTGLLARARRRPTVCS